MNDYTERIARLDVSLFDGIPSQTTPGCRRSLLAVQRATAARYKEYAYLEIGSHLGGTIQPHLADNRCKTIYSIDLRVPSQPDDRSPGYVERYEGNSTRRMLAMLSDRNHENMAKIRCFESDASQVDPSEIRPGPAIAFLDGEHTHSATLSDFRFCNRVLSERGAILFHDAWIVYGAVADICRGLEKARRVHLALPLEGSVFGIFFDPDLVRADPYLALRCGDRRRLLLKLRTDYWIRERLRNPLRKGMRRLTAARTSGRMHTSSPR